MLVLEFDSRSIKTWATNFPQSFKIARQIAVNNKVKKLVSSKS